MLWLVSKNLSKGVMVLEIPDLMRSNVGRAKNKRLVIISSCIVQDFPDIVKNFLKDNDYPVKTCPEAEHINMIGYKIASFISYSNINEVAVISVEGSFHCIQLHYIVEDIRKHFLDFEAKHYVLSKGKLVEVRPRTIKISRHLAKLEKILSSYEKNRLFPFSNP